MRGSVLAFAAGLGLAAAGCPNSCSGHGQCSQNDICTCNSMWTGADCSERICLYGPAWAADAANPHEHVECSNQGTCNRATGECDCFPGFFGRACTRMACPNNCSGNGFCKMLKDLNTTVPYAVSNWDADRIMGCQCDAGYHGADCSLRYCPTGDDPLTLCTSNVRNHVQEIKFILGSETKHAFSGPTFNAYTIDSEEMDIFGTADGNGPSAVMTGTNFQMRVSYVDAFGAKYTASPANWVLAATADTKPRDSLEVALETLPDNKVKDVVITTGFDQSIANSIFQRRYLVTFKADTTNSINVGIQQPLVVDSGYACPNAGCSPKIRMPFLYRYATAGQELSFSADGMTTSTSITQIENTGTAESTKFAFMTGTMNGIALGGSNRFDKGYIVRLHPDSQPQMLPGIAVDTAVSADFKRRYDMRILVAVVDPDGDGGDTPNDVYYTKVIVGHDNIMSDSERVGFEHPNNGVWGSGATAGSVKAFKPTIKGFTYQGKIPPFTGLSKVPLAGAPGVYLNFPSVNMVTTNNAGRWYEILIKLPHAVVTPISSANQIKEIDTTKGYVKPVDINVENVECSSRGSCDRSTGTCACYSGYYGNACHLQSAIV